MNRAEHVSLQLLGGGVHQQTVLMTGLDPRFGMLLQQRCKTCGS